jgi:hypothetical protein
MITKIGGSLMAAALFSLAGCASQSIPFSATLSVASGATTAAPTTMPVPPFYAAECAKLPLPGSAANAGGTATLSYTPASKTLTYTINYSGLSGPAMMSHYHQNTAVAGSPMGGPIVQTLCGMPPPDVDSSSAGKLGHSHHQLNGEVCPAANGGSLSGSYVLKGNPGTKAEGGMTAEQEEQLLMAGKLYINFHTCLNMGGEINGLVVPK